MHKNCPANGWTRWNEFITHLLEIAADYIYCNYIKHKEGSLPFILNGGLPSFTNIIYQPDFNFLNPEPFTQISISPA